MIELRWLERKTGRQAMDQHGFYYDETLTVLQKRVYYDATMYGGLGPHGEFSKQMVWSEWTDIPVVKE